MNYRNSIKLLHHRQHIAIQGKLSQTYSSSTKQCSQRRKNLSSDKSNVFPMIITIENQTIRSIQECISYNIYYQLTRKYCQWNIQHQAQTVYDHYIFYLSMLQLSYAYLKSNTNKSWHSWYFIYWHVYLPCVFTSCHISFAGLCSSNINFSFALQRCALWQRNLS